MAPTGAAALDDATRDRLVALADTPPLCSPVGRLPIWQQPTKWVGTFTYPNPNPIYIYIYIYID